MLRQSAPSADSQTTQNWEERLIHQTVVCAAIQRALHRLEKWAERNLMNFSQGKCKVLHLGRNNSMYRGGLGTDQLESSFTENALEVLGDTKLNMCQQCALAGKKAASIMGCIEEHHQQVEGGDPSPLLSIGETHLKCCVQLSPASPGVYPAPTALH